MFVWGFPGAIRPFAVSDVWNFDRTEAIPGPPDDLPTKRPLIQDLQDHATKNGNQ